MEKWKGQWVARFVTTPIGPAPITHAHLIESIVDTRVVTNCGRQMERKLTPRWRGDREAYLDLDPDGIRCLLCQ